MNVAALASTSHQPGLFDMVASPWFWVRVGGSKPPGSYTAYCPNVNLGGVARPSRHDRPPRRWGVSPVDGIRSSDRRSRTSRAPTRGAPQQAVGARNRRPWSALASAHRRLRPRRGQVPLDDGALGSPRRRHRQRLTVVRDRAGEVAEPLPHPAAVVPRPRILRGEPDRLRIVVDRTLQIADRLSDGATVVPSIGVSG